MQDFQKLIDRIVETTGGTKRDLAKAIGITPFAFSRLKNGASPEICLRIAKQTKANPSRLLRAAGHTNYADLVERLYGAAASRETTSSDLSSSERVMILAFRQLPKSYRGHFQLLIELAASRFVVTPAPAKDRRRRRRKHIA